jgi:hypothetical protein
MTSRLAWIVGLLAALGLSAEEPAPPPPAAKDKPRSVVITPETVKETDRYVKGYEMGTTKYDDLKDVLDKIKSPKGSISYVPGSNKLLVYDVAAVHEQVEQILGAATGRAINITIDVEFVNVQELKSRGIKLSYDYDDGSSGRLRGKLDAHGKLHRPTGASVDLTDQTGGESHYTSQSIMTASGRPAQLWVTTTALDKSMLSIYKPIPFQITTTGSTTYINTGYQPEIIVREVGSSLWVQPTYQIGRAHV